MFRSSSFKRLSHQNQTLVFIFYHRHSIDVKYCNNICLFILSTTKETASKRPAFVPSPVFKILKSLLKEIIKNLFVFSKISKQQYLQKTMLVSNSQFTVDFCAIPNQKSDPKAPYQDTEKNLQALRSYSQAVHLR